MEIFTEKRHKRSHAYSYYCNLRHTPTLANTPVTVAQQGQRGSRGALCVSPWSNEGAGSFAYLPSAPEFFVTMLARSALQTGCGLAFLQPRHGRQRSGKPLGGLHGSAAVPGAASAWAGRGASSGGAAPRTTACRLLTTIRSSSALATRLAGGATRRLSPRTGAAR